MEEEPADQSQDLLSSQIFTDAENQDPVSLPEEGGQDEEERNQNAIIVQEQSDVLFTAPFADPHVFR